jgi:hypothetical protein
VIKREGRPPRPRSGRSRRGRRRPPQERSRRGSAVHAPQRTQSNPGARTPQPQAAARCRSRSGQDRVTRRRRAAAGASTPSHRGGGRVEVGSESGRRMDGALQRDASADRRRRTRDAGAESLRDPRGRERLRMVCPRRGTRAPVHTSPLHGHQDSPDSRRRAAMHHASDASARPGSSRRFARQGPSPFVPPCSEEDFHESRRQAVRAPRDRSPLRL